MASRAVETTALELVISARNELLRQKTQESEGIIADFEKAAERELEKLEQKMGNLKVQNLSNSLKVVRQEFRDSFTDIQKMAADALTLPAISGGGLNLGSGAAREAAEAARQQAVTTRIIADAAVRAAAAEGELSRETEIYARAAVSAAVASERRADDLAREAGALERLEIETIEAARAAGVLEAAQNNSARTTGRAVVSTGQMRAAQQQLTYNLGDAVTMWGMGMRPMQIFVSQASQVTGAIGLMSNSSKGFIGFIGGPWMQVILAAVTILGVMAATDKDAASAKKTHRDAADDLRDAVDRLNSASAAASQSTRQGIVDSINAAKAYRQQAVEARKAAVAALELARAKLLQQRDSFDRAGGEGDGIAAGAGASIAERSTVARIDTLDKNISALNGAIITGSNAMIAGSEQLLKRAAEAASDPRAAIQQRYSDREGEIRREARRTGNFSNVQRDLTSAAAEREAAEKALTPNNSAARRAEADRRRELGDDYSYVGEERQARKKLLDATLRTADSEAQRDQLLREDIDAEAKAQAQKIGLRLDQGKISKEEADHLLDLNKRNQAQRLQNIDIERASDIIQRKATIEEHDLDARIALLRIQEDLVTTNEERRRIAGEILALEQKQARDRLQRVIDDPRATPDDRDQATRDKAARAPIEQAQRQQLDRQTESPLAAYRRQIADTTNNMGEAFESIEARGLSDLNDGLADAIVNSKDLGDVFKTVANQIIADLVRVAIQQTIVNQLLGSGGTGGSGGMIGGFFKMLGFSSGGYTGNIGRERVAGVVHGEEYVFDAASVAQIGVPTLDAIRNGTFTGPSIGGAAETAHNAAAARASGGVVRIEMAEGAMFEPRVTQISGDVSVQVVRAAAPELTNTAVAETTRYFSRGRI